MAITKEEVRLRCLEISYTHRTNYSKTAEELVDIARVLEEYVVSRAVSSGKKGSPPPTETSAEARKGSDKPKTTKAKG